MQSIWEQVAAAQTLRETNDPMNGPPLLDVLQARRDAAAARGLSGRHAYALKQAAIYGQWAVYAEQCQQRGVLLEHGADEDAVPKKRRVDGALKKGEKIMGLSRLLTIAADSKEDYEWSYW